MVLPRFSPWINGWLALSQYGLAEIHVRLNVPSNEIYHLPPIVSAPDRHAGVQDEVVRPFVLALGHIEPRKNLETLVRAALEPNWPPEVELWIAGKDQGSLTALQALAASASPGRIRFLGGVSENDKWKLLSDALIVAVPSLIEGFGIVAAEAPLVGTPALVSDQAALPELAAHHLAQLPAMVPSEWAERVNLFWTSASVSEEVLSAQVVNAQELDKASVVPAFVEICREALRSSRHVAPRAAFH